MTIDYHAVPVPESVVNKRWELTGKVVQIWRPSQRVGGRLPMIKIRVIEPDGGYWWLECTCPRALNDAKPGDDVTLNVTVMSMSEFGWDVPRGLARGWNPQTSIVSHYDSWPQRRVT